MKYTGNFVPVYERDLGPFNGGEGYFSPLMHEDFVPHASKGLRFL
jgi:hypothetical protein